MSTSRESCKSRVLSRSRSNWAQLELSNKTQLGWSNRVFRRVFHRVQALARPQGLWQVSRWFSVVISPEQGLEQASRLRKGQAEHIWSAPCIRISPCEENDRQPCWHKPKRRQKLGRISSCFFGQLGYCFESERVRIDDCCRSAIAIYITHGSDRAPHLQSSTFFCQLFLNAFNWIETRCIRFLCLDCYTYRFWQPPVY